MSATKPIVCPAYKVCCGKGGKEIGKVDNQRVVRLEICAKRRSPRRHCLDDQELTGHTPRTELNKIGEKRMSIKWSLIIVLVNRGPACLQVQRPTAKCYVGAQKSVEDRKQDCRTRGVKDTTNTKTQHQLTWPHKGSQRLNWLKELTKAWPRSSACVIAV